MEEDHVRERVALGFLVVVGVHYVSTYIPNG